MHSIKLVLLVLLIISFHSQTVSKHHPTIDGLLDRLDSLLPTSSVQESAAKGLLQRLLPTHSQSFELRIISKVLPFISLGPTMLGDSSVLIVFCYNRMLVVVPAAL
jgi:hypothetical protein